MWFLRVCHYISNQVHISWCSICFYFPLFLYHLFISPCFSISCLFPPVSLSPLYFPLFLYHLFNSPCFSITCLFPPVSLSPVYFPLFLYNLFISPLFLYHLFISPLFLYHLFTPSLPLLRVIDRTLWWYFKKIECPCRIFIVLYYFTLSKQTFTLLSCNWLSWQDISSFICQWLSFYSAASKSSC